VEYKYDALGRRIVKKVKAPNSIDTVTRYVHDGYQVIEERNDSDQVTYRYTYGNGIDERIEIEKHVKNQDGNYEWKSYLPLHDSIGNVTALTSDKGYVIERYNYSPYGEVTYFNSENAPEVDNIKIENGKIRISFNRPVDLNDISIDFYITATHSQITGPKIIINMDRDIEFSPSQIPQDQSLTIKIDAMDELSGGSTQPVQLLLKDFIYQGESSLLVHDQGPPRVERIEYESSSNCLILNLNETINPSSITNSVEIEYGGNIIPGSIDITGDNRIKFTPSGNLSPNVDYIIRVKDIKDAAGKTIEVFSYNFELNQDVSLVFNYSILAKNTHSLYGNNSLMHGRDYEPEIGLYYFRNRYYHPQLGRFLQQDPMGYEDSQNLYQAFGMNPVNFLDPFGLQGFDEIDNPLFRKFRNWELQVRSEYNYSGPFRVQWEQGTRGRPYVDIITGLGPMRLYNYELRKLHPYIDERDLLIRGGGLVQTIWGAVQIKMAAAIAATSGGALSPLSVALIAMGTDNIVAGSSKVITGRPQDTLLNKGLQEGAKLISDDPKFQTNFANYGEFGLNLFAGGIAYNQLSQPGQMLPGTIQMSGEYGKSQNFPYKEIPELPPYTGGKASGVLRIKGEGIPLESGYIGPSSNMPKGTPGMNWRIKSHIEAHSAAIMRERGVTEATLYINRIPCSGRTGCDAMLPRMLPTGSKLTVIGPDGYIKTYIAIPD
jgi:RHS repeat-associated protein